MAVHPICHRTIHACFSTVELARLTKEGTPLSSQPDMANFVAWIAGKPPDFHAPPASPEIGSCGRERLVAS